jgi:hypothetical protein
LRISGGIAGGAEGPPTGNAVGHVPVRDVELFAPGFDKRDVLLVCHHADNFAPLRFIRRGCAPMRDLFVNDMGCYRQL